MVFTPAERRAILVLVGLLVLGAARDAWVAAGLRRAGPAAGDDAAATSGPPVTPSGAAAPADSAPAAPPAAGRVNLNAAGAEELDTLPGIGPVLAGRIVEFRARNGPFRSVDELRAVRGVGPRLLERLRGRIEVAGPAAGRPGPDPATAGAAAP
jgi:competence protein ComEA